MRVPQWATSRNPREGGLNAGRVAGHAWTATCAILRVAISHPRRPRQAYLAVTHLTQSAICGPTWRISESCDPSDANGWSLCTLPRCPLEAKEVQQGWRQRVQLINAWGTKTRTPGTSYLTCPRCLPQATLPSKRQAAFGTPPVLTNGKYQAVTVVGGRDVTSRWHAGG